MTRLLLPRASSMVLVAGLAVVAPLSARAQLPGPTTTTGPGAPISSGSGTGTGTGSITGTGGTSTTGSGSTITGSPRGSRIGSQGFGTGGPGSPGVPPMGLGRSPDTGPGGGAHFPDDPSLVPLEVLQGPKELELGKMSGVTTIDPKLLRRARDIRDASERALALQRLANAAIFSNELVEAHHALTEAGNAALELSPSLIRDQRLVAIITTLINLAEADLREGKTDLTAVELVEPLPKEAPEKLIQRARHEWDRAAFLAVRISNPTYRSEQHHRIVENQAAGSQTIVNEFPRETSKDDEKGKKIAAANDALADQILVDSAREALQIERPVWRDRALVAIAGAAAASKQFARGIEVSELIPQPEVRSDALIRLAEAQARSDDPNSATTTYEEAAKSVASIPLEDPRAVIAGVLIDNLISVGRFDDARASIVLYPDTPRRLIALGAIARSQGRRGAGDAAREWIMRDVPEQYRPLLQRRVIDGIIEAVESNRSRALSRPTER